MKNRMKKLATIGLCMVTAITLLSSATVFNQQYEMTEIVYAAEVSTDDRGVNKNPEIDIKQKNAEKLPDEICDGTAEENLQDVSTYNYNEEISEHQEVMESFDNAMGTLEEDSHEVEYIGQSEQTDISESEVNPEAVTESLTDLVQEDMAKLNAVDNGAEVIDSGNCGDSATWTLYDDGSLVISGSGTIYDHFKHKDKIISVSISNSITGIGEYAFFYCSSLKSISIPNSVTSIGDYAFYGCESLTNITIPDSVTSIGFWVSYGNSSLMNIDVDSNNSVYSSVDGVLYDKARTKLITCPPAKSGRFSIPNSVTSIDGDAFYNCSHLTSISIPNSVISIGETAFYGCSSLTDINIPDSVESIGRNAFYGCSSLKNIDIPNSVTSIGDNTFMLCSSLMHINVAPGNAEYSSADGVLYDKTKTKLIRCPLAKNGSFSVPDSVTRVEFCAFHYCDSLTSIIIPDSVTSIGYNAFWGCSNLTSISIPNSVTSIETYAFMACDNLTIETFSGSYAEQYAKENDIPVKIIKQEGLSRGTDGNLYYYKNNTIQKKVDVVRGTVNGVDGWWYVNSSGKADSAFTGMAKSSELGWVYVSKGKWDTGYTGMAKNAYGWWYMKNGRLDQTYTGMAKNAYGWWYMKNGKLDQMYTGMAKNAYGWWYMKNSRLDQTYTGMAKNAYGWWYMKNGKLDQTYTGMAKNAYGWWYMKNGKLDTTFTGIAQNQYGSWYMVKGKLAGSYNGKIKYGSKTYTVKNGKATQI